MTFDIIGGPCVISPYSTRLACLLESCFGILLPSPSVKLFTFQLANFIDKHIITGNPVVRHCHIHIHIQHIFEYIEEREH